MRPALRHPRSTWTLATGLAALVFAICWMVLRTPGTHAEPVADNTVSNPHWQIDACKSCHLMNGQKAQPIAPTEVDHLCLSCHDGQHASSEVHPIAREVAPGKFTIPKDWPLVNDRVACVTCHDVRAACNPTPGTAPEDPMFLRGHEKIDPTSTQARDFCQNCHKSDGTKRFDPHLMLDSKNQIIENRCLFCHEKVLDRNTMTRTGNPQLRVSQLVLCKSCHHTHKEILKGGHLDVKVNDDFAAYMRLREIIGLVAEPNEVLVAQLKAQKARPTHMFLEKDGGVRCATCHNPHQEGLFPAGSDLYYRTMHVVDGHPVSPVHEQNFCRNCHRL